MTITGLIDANGTAVVNYRYDSWGILTGITGSMAGTLGKDNPYRFKGYYYDEETGMYYLKSRYYQPEICRFISADDEDVLSVKTDFDDCNLYAYCDYNPISRLDETGDVWQAALAGGWVIGESNAWNPVGQMVLGIITAVSVVYGAKKLYKFAKSKRGKARPELKKQGRENQEKKKQQNNWKKKSGKKPRQQPRPHHPSKKGHRKYQFMFEI